MPSNRSIPGVTGKRIPGNGRMKMPRQRGGLLTNVPFQRSGSQDFAQRHVQQVRNSSGQFAGGWGVAWQGLAEIAANAVDYVDGVKQSVGEAAESLKDEMVDYMKKNAPWSDESGNARRELQGIVVWDDEDHFTIMLGHGKDIYYGIWLEVRWGGRFAIILPTVYHFAPQFSDKVRTMT